MLIILALISIYFFENKYLNTHEYRIINNKIDNIRNLSTKISNILDVNILNKIENFKNIILEKLTLVNSNSIFLLGRGKMYPLFW